MTYEINGKSCVALSRLKGMETEAPVAISRIRDAGCVTLSRLKGMKTASVGAVSNRAYR